MYKNPMQKRNIFKVLCVYLAALFIVSIGLQGEAKAADPVKKEETKKEESKKEEPKKAEAAKSEKADSKKGKDVIAIFETNKGTIRTKLYADKTPKTVENFVGLAKGTKEFTDPKTGQKTKRAFYDGLTFHRVIPNFMIQGGCPKGDGTGDPGYRFEDEIVADLKHNKPGLLSMANSGKNTNGSQFFITVAATPWLDGKHTVWGEVADAASLDVVMNISKVKTGPMDKPAEPIIIKSVKFE